MYALGVDGLLLTLTEAWSDIWNDMVSVKYLYRNPTAHAMNECRSLSKSASTAILSRRQPARLSFASSSSGCLSRLLEQW